MAVPLNLAAEPVQAIWSSGGIILDDHVELSIGDPNLNYFSGEFSCDEVAPNGIFFGLRVNAENRNNKIGTRLVSALAHVALSRGVVELHGGVESQYAIKIFRSLFGEENLRYYDYDPSTVDTEFVSLPITTDEAISLLEGYERLEEDLEHRSIGFGVSIDLSHVDIALLEQPIVTEASPPHGAIFD